MSNRYFSRNDTASSPLNPMVFCSKQHSKFHLTPCFSFKKSCVVRLTFQFSQIRVKNMNFHTFLSLKFLKLVISSWGFQKMGQNNHDASFSNDFFQQNGVYKLCFQISNFTDCTKLYNTSCAVVLCLSFKSENCAVVYCTTVVFYCT